MPTRNNCHSPHCTYHAIAVLAQAEEFVAASDVLRTEVVRLQKRAKGDTNVST